MEEAKRDARDLLRIELPWSDTYGMTRKQFRRAVAAIQRVASEREARRSYRLGRHQKPISA